MTQPRHTEGATEAPSNNLPDWGECAMRVTNSDFIAKRVAEGGHGPDSDSKLANELHRFIYEYDDADAFRSAWFLHRLELLLEETRRAALSGWQPIETAPKANRHMFVVQAFDVTHPTCGVRRYTSDPYCVWPGDTGGWVRWPHPFPPTHWMNLPTPPAPNQGAES